MCDTFLCERCLCDVEDTDVYIHTSNYEYLCESCLGIDREIERLDEDISECLDVLDLRPSDYNTALELNQKQRKLNEILKTW